MTAIQQALEGMPEPEPREDFETWAEKVRPAFVTVAASGRRHWLTWQIKKEFKLPDPPDPAHDWGAFTSQLCREGLIQHDGFGRTADGSCVNAWTGTTAAIQGRAA